MSNLDFNNILNSTAEFAPAIKSRLSKFNMEVNKPNKENPYDNQNLKEYKDMVDEKKKNLVEVLNSKKYVPFDTNMKIENEPLPTKRDVTYNSNEQKYGDDEKFESLADNYLFFPIAKALLDPMRNVGLTPNMVTYLSTALTFLALYYLYVDNELYACVAYFFGYIFDCIDGKMARKYNMGTKYGMALDLVSDNLSHFILISYLTLTKGYFHWYTPLIIFMSYMISLSYGLNEAIDSMAAVGNDNFYERRKKELMTESGLIYDTYLFIIHKSYTVYKFFFPTYDIQKIDKWLNILKNFGPGNFSLFMIFILLNY
jgi:hypothetical protein